MKVTNVEKKEKSTVELTIQVEAVKAGIFVKQFHVRVDQIQQFHFMPL